MSLNRVIGSKGFDWITFLIYSSLVVFGVISLYSVQYEADSQYAFFDITRSEGRYFLFIVLSFVFFYFTYLIEWRFWDSVALPTYLISLFLLIVVLFLGSDIKGARSWFNILGFSFQPSEFAKFGTALALSSFLSQHKKETLSGKILLQSVSIILFPMLLILLQPDAGSALIFLSLFVLLYRAGLNPLFYIIGILIALTFVLTLKFDSYIVSLSITGLALVLLILVYWENKYLKTIFIAIVVSTFYLYKFPFGVYLIPVNFIAILIVALNIWFKRHQNTPILFPIASIVLILMSFSAEYSFNNFLKPHQQDRINVWLNPDKCDPRGSLYNILQSKTAIGSGGLFGKGFLEGSMTHLNFVPEQSTDFIFSSIGEERGFIGVFVLILLFTLLIIRIFMIAERAKTIFITYFAYALGGYILIHFVMNVGMNMGILPVIGIPLIFISKGGSSLIVFSIMMGALLKMDAERSVR
ncbi:MAG: rod shape-determining protein RodA [Saprospiraceae bacterium]